MASRSWSNEGMEIIGGPGRNACTPNVITVSPAWQSRKGSHASSAGGMGLPEPHAGPVGQASACRARVTTRSARAVRRCRCRGGWRGACGRSA
jgi:hypothetical protein